MKSDEIWHFYAGSSLTLYIIHRNGSLDEIRLGQNSDNNEVFQWIIESGSWFAAYVNDSTSYSLIGCTVSPGFNYHDWELADITNLVHTYPQHRSIIEKFKQAF
jgi:predicted cupin superfamily sugar epimerase